MTREFDRWSSETRDGLDRAASRENRSSKVDALTAASCAASTYGISFVICAGAFAACECPGGAAVCLAGVAGCIESARDADENYRDCVESQRSTSDNLSSGAPFGASVAAAAAIGF